MPVSPLQGLVALAVNYPPCGHCRQFLNEIDGGIDIEVMIADNEAIEAANPEDPVRSSPAAPPQHHYPPGSPKSISAKQILV